MLLDVRREHRTRRRSWPAWLLVVVLLAGCGSSSVTGAQTTCRGEQGSGTCEGTYDMLNGRYPERIDTGSGDDAVEVHGRVSVEQGTVEVSFASPDGQTTSAEATPGQPAAFSGPADVSGDGFDVVFESIGGEASGITYTISYQPPSPASAGSSEPARSERAGRVSISAELHDDGALRIREEREFVYTGSFQGAVYRLPLDVGQRVTLHGIADDQGTPYREGSCSPDGDKVPGTYQVDDVDQFMVTWCWDPPPTDTTRSIVLDYTVTNAAWPPEKPTDLTWQFIGDGWNMPTASVDVVVRLPGDEAHVLDHRPADAVVDDTEPGTVRLQVDDLPPTTPVELSVALRKEDVTPENSTQLGSDPDALVEPVTDGWQGVRNAKRPIAYDVPPDWIALTPGIHVGFEEPDPDAPFGYAPTVMMSGASQYGRTSCRRDSHSLATVGTSGMGEVVDTAKGAEATAIKWARAAYDSETGDAELDVSDPEPFEAHGLRGHIVTVDVVPGDDICAPERAHVRAASVHVPSEDDVYNLILYATTSGDDVVDARTMDTIFSSLRLHDET